MEFVRIFAPDNYLFSVQYDGENDTIYDQLIAKWTDMEWCLRFFNENQGLLTRSEWKETPEPFSATDKLIDEAYYLIKHLKAINENTKHCQFPNIDDTFKYFYKNSKPGPPPEPYKLYGGSIQQKPSFIRIYAIKVDDNCYVIFGGGIKLTKDFRESPDMGTIYTKLNLVVNELKFLGVDCSEDLLEIAI